MDEAIDAFQNDPDSDADMEDHKCPPDAKSRYGQSGQRVMEV